MKTPDSSHSVRLGSCSIPSTESRSLLGMRVDGTSYDAVTEHVLLWAKARQSRYICEAPVHMVMEAHDDANYRRVINEADVVAPGGMPVVWTLRRLGLYRQPRVYGPEITLHVCRGAAAEKVPVGFYGATDATLRLLTSNLRQRNPGLDVAYVHAPPFRPLTDQEDASVVQQINASGCRILFVGLGCPKQEKWMAAHRGRVFSVMLGVGAAFDFISGVKKQAPARMQRLGLEWLFRVATEPRRLWFRHFYHDPRFLALISLQILKHRLTRRGLRPHEMGRQKDRETEK